VFQHEQAVVDRELPASSETPGVRSAGEQLDRLARPSSVEQERAARATLRAQITKLENELSGIIADRFPFIYAPALAGSEAGAGGPRLPGLAELERARDRLAGRLQELSALAARRTEHERRARELLEAMKLEPGRYKYYRVPVRDLGEGGCGVWEVRPRLGLIGMLAGWWQLKLSSGCPLPRGSRSTRGPGEP
jgi:hypothetical protein